jgi:hypothetical protein
MLTAISEFLFAGLWLAGVVTAVAVVVFFGYALVDLIGERIFGESPLERRMR